VTDSDDRIYNDYLLAMKELDDSSDLKKEKAISFSYRPKISLITTAFNMEERWLRVSIEAAIRQLYDNWELCIAAGDPTDAQVKAALDEYARKDDRIKITFLQQDTGIAGSSNAALSMATGELIGLVGDGDELSPGAIYEIVKLLNENEDIDFIYTDEDRILADGRRCDPQFKPDWSPDLLRSYNYIGHFAAIRKELLDEVAGFRKGLDGAENYDLFLRITERTLKVAHIPKVLYHMTSAGLARSYANEKRALKEHLARTGLSGEVDDGAFPGAYRVKYEIKGSPRVTIVIPTKDKMDILKKCLESILDKSTYENYEILVVDNQSTEAGTFRYYETLQNNAKVRVIKYDRPFNFAAINNYAVQYVDSEYIIFLNNDTEVISADWIETMLGFARREDVGVVGALLYHPDDTIQHAGVIVGINGITGHPFKNLARKSLGYMGRAKVSQNLSAVTGACLVTKKCVFEEAGGFDEVYSYGFNDIDLCLKLRAKGYVVVYTPNAELYHYEFATRGGEDKTPVQLKRHMTEISVFLERWRTVIERGDPYYNRNLSLIKGDYRTKHHFEIFCHFPDIYTYYATQRNTAEYLEDKKVYIAELERTIGEHVKELEDALRPKNEYIIHLWNVLASRENDLGALRARIENGTARIEQLQTTLDGIYGSRGWRMFSVSRRLWSKVVDVFSR
jgi:glycosyltransferase involved in cell wall biosynthesis